MASVSQATAKRLFAVSGNKCAFPKCPLELVDRLSGKVTGRICHIRAASPRGSRYDPHQTDAERYDYANLILLCPIHHDVVDADEISYTVERLLKMKADHEVMGAHGRPFDLPSELADAILKISEEMNVAGLALVVVNQSGAQFVAQRPAEKERLRAQVTDKILELWQLFHLAYRALIDVTSPLQQFADLSRMSEAQFEEWLTTSELPDFKKDELRRATNRTKHYSEIRVWSQLDRASAAHRNFNNALVIAHPLLTSNIKEAFNSVNSTMQDVLSRMNIATEARDYKMRSEAATLAFSIQKEVPVLEDLIHQELYDSQP